MQPYSVLVMYPDALTDGQVQTSYLHVWGENPERAADNAIDELCALALDPNAYTVLLIIAGHHPALPTPTEEPVDTRHDPDA